MAELGRIKFNNQGQHGRPYEKLPLVVGQYEDENGVVDESADVNEKLAEIVSKQLEESGGIKLNLYCRLNPIKGYINIDVTRAADVVFVCGNLQFLTDSTVDEIRAINAMQHFYHDDNRIVLTEWRRVLKPSGLLHIEMPDIREMAKRIAVATDFELFDAHPPLMWGVDGSQVDWDAIGDTNRNGLTKTRLIQWLETTGYANIEEVETVTEPKFCPFALKAYKRVIVTE